MTPPQNGFLSPPTRGSGSLALNTAGNREDTVNFQINGITLNDQVNNILNFNPPLTSIREFKIDNSSFSAEYGRNSGAIVNVVRPVQERRNSTASCTNISATARWMLATFSTSPPASRHHSSVISLARRSAYPLRPPRFGEGGPAFRGGKDRAFFFFN